MNKKKEKIEIEKCPICGRMIFTISGNQVDNNGEHSEGCICECGWHKTNSGKIKPDEIDWPNHISLNKAKQYYQLGQPLNPDYDDFIAMVKYWGEIQFFYLGTKYGVCSDWDSVYIYFWNGNIVCKYSTIEEFTAKANLNGVLLKDLWPQVKDVDWAN